MQNVPLKPKKSKLHTFFFNCQFPAAAQWWYGQKYVDIRNHILLCTVALVLGLLWLSLLSPIDLFHSTLWLIGRKTHVELLTLTMALINYLPLLITPVLYLLCHVKMSAMKKVTPPKHFSIFYLIVLVFWTGVVSETFSPSICFPLWRPYTVQALCTFYLDKLVYHPPYR